MTSDFYDRVGAFDDFGHIVDDGMYRPLPDGWQLGVADVVNSTAAIRAGRYKAVNLAGAAAISAITNALGQRPYPVVFGGDGARFAIAPEDVDVVRDALARTARWAQEELDLELRVALIPVEAIRQAGRDVRVARYAASPAVSYANFAGRGAAWAEAQAKAGRFTVEPAPPGSAPDLTGLSCQWGPIRSRKGVILSLIVRPAATADRVRFMAVIAGLLDTLKRQKSGSPIPDAGPDPAWSRPAMMLQAHVVGRKPRSLAARRLRTLAISALGWMIFKGNLKIGGFDAARYRREVGLNTDFKKYDDALMMTVDCSEAGANAIEQTLVQARSEGIVDYGLHRQASALLTCVVPSLRGDQHLHFLDGGEGGYTRAAERLKAAEQRATVDAA